MFPANISILLYPLYLLARVYMYVYMCDIVYYSNVRWDCIKAGITFSFILWSLRVGLRNTLLGYGYVVVFLSEFHTF